MRETQPLHTTPLVVLVVLVVVLVVLVDLVDLVLVSSVHQEGSLVVLVVLFHLVLVVLVPALVLFHLVLVVLFHLVMVASYLMAQHRPLLQQRLQFRKTSTSPPHAAPRRKVDTTPHRKVDTTPSTAEAATFPNCIASPDHLVTFHPKKLKDHHGLAILIQIVLPTHSAQRLVADRTRLRRQNQSNHQQQQKSKSK